MKNFRINKKIASLYGMFGAAALGTGIYFYSEAQQAERLNHMDSLLAEAKVLDLREVKINVAWNSNPVFHSYYNSSTLAKQDDNMLPQNHDLESLEPGPERICAFLKWREQAAQNYLNEASPGELALFLPNPTEFITAAKDDSPAEKALCPK